MARRRSKAAWHSTVFVVGVGAAVAGLAWLAWRRRGGGTSAALLDGAGGLIDDVLSGGGGSTDTGTFLDAPTQQPIGGGVIVRERRPPTLDEVRRLIDDNRSELEQTKMYTGGSKDFYSPSGPGRAVPVDILPTTTTSSTGGQPVRRVLGAR